MALIEVISAFLTEYAVEFGALGGIAGISAVVWAVITKPFQRSKPTALAQETIDQIKPAVVKDVPSMTVTDFIRLRRELKADLETDLEQADATEKDQLRARIAELESQIANPEASLSEAQKRIRDLEEILDRAGNEIGGDRIAEARAALEQGDYSIADDLFAEIEAREQMAVENAARAAFGRGEVAEAEVRWAAAAAHYARAATLSPTYNHLFKASDFALKAGDFDAGLRFAQEMEAKARAEGDKSNQSLALGRAATAFENSGNYPAAEPLFRETLALYGELEGKETKNYAAGLNNLAELLRATGRYEEAEPLYREALEIDRKTVGATHPEYAIDLNNLALLLQATGRYEEAEPLYREALEIDRKTLGEAHPDYAIRLNNLALLLEATGRYEEAEPLYREALAVIETALGAEHPTTVTIARNLERFLAARP